MIAAKKNILYRVLFSQLFWLLVLCAAFRGMWQTSDPRVTYNSDTASYCYAAKNIVSGTIDPFRTPAYPILIAIFEYFNSYNPFYGIVIFQHIFSVLSIIPLYLTGKILIQNRFIVFFTCLFYGCCTLIIDYNNALFPESILLSLLVWLIYFLSDYFQKPTALKAITINLFIFLLVMVKPFCIFLYGVLPGIWMLKFFKERNRDIFKYELTGWTLSFMLVMGYSGINKAQNDAFAVSTVNHDNNFANVILSNAYSNFPDERLVHIIDTMKQKGHYYTVFYLNNDHEVYQRRFATFPSFFPLTHDMLYVLGVPPNELGYSSKNLAPLVRNAMFSWEYVHYIMHGFLEFSNSNLGLFRGRIVYILILVELVFLISIIRSGKRLQWMRVFSVISIISITAVVIVCGINDGTWARVQMPLYPFLFVSFIILLQHFGVLMKRAFLKVRNG